MISIKNEQEIDLMRKSGKITYDLLMSLKDYIKPGMTTKQIDKYAHDFIVSRDAIPSFLGYEGYPASTCISINDMVVHGIPDNTKIKNGDIWNDSGYDINTGIVSNRGQLKSIVISAKAIDYLRLCGLYNRKLKSRNYGGGIYPFFR